MHVYSVKVYTTGESVNVVLSVWPRARSFVSVIFRRIQKIQLVTEDLFKAPLASAYEIVACSVPTAGVRVHSNGILSPVMGQFNEVIDKISHLRN